MAKNRKTLEDSKNYKKTPSKDNSSNTRSSNFFVKAKNKTVGKFSSQNLNTISKTKTEDDIETKPQKKPFDKKAYRLKKYSKKYKLQQWEDNRKKVVLKDFYKQIKDSDSNFDVNKIYNDPRNRDTDEESEDTTEKIPTSTNSSITETDKDINLSKTVQKTKQKPFYRAKEAFRRIKEDKEKKKQEFLNKKLEKEEALKKYRKEKAVKFKKLSRKTKKGQPIMKDRMEMLLEKIQKMN